MGIATGAALVGAGVSAFQGIKGAKAADEAGDRADQSLAAQQAMFDRQVELGEDNLAYFRDVFSKWEEEFAPVLDELKAEAMSGVTPDYTAIASDTRSAFQSARDSSRRELGRFGINPGDGQFGANERRYAISEAATEVGAREQARRAADTERFGKLQALYGIGSGEKRTALGGVSNASGQFQGALGGVAAGQGRNADRYGNAAAGASQAAFGQDWDSIINGALGAFGNMGGGGNEAPDYGPAPPGSSGTAPWRQNSGGGSSGGGNPWWAGGG